VKNGHIQVESGLVNIPIPWDAPGIDISTFNPPKTNNNWHLKIDGWNVEISLFWGLFGLFSVAKWLLVTCREGSNLPPPRKKTHHINPTYHINTNVITA